MATSSCPKCGGHYFEINETKIEKATFRTMFIQCSSCGTVVGVQEFYNLGNLIYKLAKKLRIDLDN